MTTREAGALVAGRYRLERPLGAGGMGEVWVATNIVTSGRVALKFLKPEYAKVPDLRLRFVREARAASAVSHPNIVTVHDVLDLDSESPVMVMELLQGEALSERLARERALTLGEVARLLVPALHGLQAAHRAGIVHRDLKPDNLFIVRHPDGTEQTKVLDFGIAKMVAAGEEDVGGALTKTGAMMGTPYYMSPEQAFGEKSIDHRSDVWSMGIIFYQCLTGILPTEAGNFGQIVKIITMLGIPPIGERAPSLPSDVASVITRMLSRLAADRPADLADVAAILQPYGSSSVADTKYVVAVAGKMPSSGQGRALTAPSSNGMAASLVEPPLVSRRWAWWLMGGVATLSAVTLAVQQRGATPTSPLQPPASTAQVVAAPPEAKTLMPLAELAERDASAPDTGATTTRLPVKLVAKPEATLASPVRPQASNAPSPKAAEGATPAGSGRVSDRLAPAPF